MQIYPPQVIASLDSIRAHIYEFRDFFDDLGDELAESEPDDIRDQKTIHDPRYCPALFLAINEIYFEIWNLHRRGYRHPDYLLEEDDQRLLKIVNDFPVLEPGDLKCLSDAIPAKSLEELRNFDPGSINDKSNFQLAKNLRLRYPEIFKIIEDLVDEA